MGRVQYETSIVSVPVTEARKPFIPSENDTLPYGTACANKAISTEHNGTPGYWESHQNKTVLQQHCEFWDADGDGVIWPLDTYRGFYALGYGVILSVVSMFIIHANFSYPSCKSILPDPFFRLYLSRVHKCKHGSDTGTYDTEGRYIPQKFEDAFAKYGGGKDGLSAMDIFDLMKGQRCIADPIGWGGAMFEWLATYILLWPEDGIMRKEDIRRVYDGSIFYEIADRRAGKLQKKQK
ncbi:MAG: hypothetical protein MMC23_008626 [Stictis urceolatum]|nr:hypothetical protein [Stictis urceolata]